MAMGMKKASLGRQKIKMAKIEVKNHLQVTFSKRRSGLFKKASELCTLCGTEIAIIVFSPAGKVFSFGHPHVESIIDRFLSKNNSSSSRRSNNNNNNSGFSNNGRYHHMPDAAVVNLVGAHRSAGIQEMNMTLTQMITELEVEKKRGEMLDKMRRESQSQCWWEAPISVLDLEELKKLRNAMDELGSVVAAQIADIIDDTSKLIAMNNSMILNEFTAIEMKPQGIMVNSHNNRSMHDFKLDQFDGSIYI